MKTVLSDVNAVEESEINAYYFPELGEYLKNHLALFPLWSNVCTDVFGFGNVPASSSASEAKFKVLKTDVFPNELPMRVDTFVRKHLEYLHGKGKIFIANTREQSDDETEDTPAEVQSTEIRNEGNMK